MHGFWAHAAIAGVVILLAAVLAKLVDGHIGRRDLAPGIATRYGVLRRTIVVAIVFRSRSSSIRAAPLS